MPNPYSAVDDRLSLTLPDWRTAAKKKIRRPKRPEWYKIFRVVWFAAFMVWSYSTGQYPEVIGWAVMLGWDWVYLIKGKQHSIKSLLIWVSFMLTAVVVQAVT